MSRHRRGQRIPRAGVAVKRFRRALSPAGRAGYGGLMLLLAGLAQAHPADYPHVHPSDPAAFAVIGFWLLAGVAFLGWALRAGGAGKHSGPQSNGPRPATLG